MKLSMKLLSILAAGSLFLAAGCSSDTKQEPLRSIQLDPEAGKVLVDTNTDIQITTDPQDIQLTDQDFTCSGGTIKVNGTNAEFSASETGTYTIFANHDDISSNTVTITVVEEENDTKEEQVPAQDTAGKPEGSSGQVADSTQDTSDTSPASSSSSDEQTSGNNSPTYIPPEASPDAIDVSSILADPNAYVGKTITIVGSLPQNAAYDSNDQPYEVIFPLSGPGDINDPKDRLRLEGENVTIGTCIAELTGTLDKETIDKDKYVFDVTSFKMIKDESFPYHE